MIIRISVAFIFCSALLIADVIWLQSTALASESAETTQAEVFRSDTPAELLADISDFDEIRSRRAEIALQRLVERGAGQMPAILDALDDVVTNHGTQAQYSHLMAAASYLGDDSHADQLIDIASRLPPEKMLSGGIFDVLDGIDARDRADSYSLQIISDPSSRQMQLLSALIRYWHKAPKEVAQAALQHLDSDSLQVRAMVYRLALNGGLQDEIHTNLINDVSSMKYGKPGNGTALNVLAIMEPGTKFHPRIQGLKLRSDLSRAALLLNEFSWASDRQKEELLPKLLTSQNGEIKSIAMAYILENRRVDLLEQHSLAHLPTSLYAMYDSVVPNFESLSRDDKLRFVNEEDLSRLEAAVAATPDVITEPRLRLVTFRLGYSITADGNVIRIDPID